MKTEKNSDLYEMIIKLLLMYSLYESSKKWDDFKNKIIYEERFTIKHDIIDLLEECNAFASTYIDENNFFYRARIYDNPEKRDEELFKKILMQLIDTKISKINTINGDFNEVVSHFSENKITYSSVLRDQQNSLENF